MASLHVISANLCYESPYHLKPSVWIDAFRSIGADVILLQECADEKHTYNLAPIFAKALEYELHIDGDQAVLSKYPFISTNVIYWKGIPVYVRSVHLTDEPYAPKELRAGKSIGEITKDSIAVRVGDIGSILKGQQEMCIVGGDFNEPSHLDSGIPYPMSKIMEKMEYVDTFFSLNLQTQATYPMAFYPDDPADRIDFIYSRGFTVDKSIHLDSGMSDHAIVSTQLSVSEETLKSKRTQLMSAQGVREPYTYIDSDSVDLNEM